MNKKIDDIRKRLGSLSKSHVRNTPAEESRPQQSAVSLGSESSPKRTGLGIEIRVRGSSQTSLPQSGAFPNQTQSDMTSFHERPAEERGQSNIRGDRFPDTQDMVSTARPLLPEDSQFQSRVILFRDGNMQETEGNLLSPRDMPVFNSMNLELSDRLATDTRRDQLPRKKDHVLGFRKPVNPVMQTKLLAPGLFRFDKVISAARKLSALATFPSRLLKLLRTLQASLKPRHSTAGSDSNPVCDNEKSLTWRVASSLADNSHLDLSSLIISSPVFVALDYFFFCCTLLVLLAFNFSPDGQGYTSMMKFSGEQVASGRNPGSMNGLHREMYGLLAKNFKMDGISPYSQGAFLFLMFCFSITGCYFTITYLRESLSAKGASTQTRNNFMFYSRVLAVKVPLCLLTITGFAARILRDLASGAASGWLNWIRGILSATSLVIVPIEVLIFILQTYDYKYVRNNFLQSKTYRFFAWRCVLAYVVSTCRYFTANSSSQLIDLFCNLALSLLAIRLTLLSSRGLVFFQAGFLETWITFLNAVVLVEAIVCSLVVAIPATLTRIPFDTVAPMAIITISIIAASCSKKLKFYKLTEYLFDILESPEKVATYYELLYDAFLNQKRPYYKFLLHLAFIGHNTHCKDPRCLCFLVNEELDGSMTSSSGKKARQIFLNYTAARDYASNGLVTFDDENIQKKFFRRHNSVVACNLDHKTKVVRVQRSEISSRQVRLELNLGSAEVFKLLMCSLYKSFFKWNYQSGELFTLVMSFLRFLLSEYENKIAVLLFLFEYKHSVRYKREASPYKFAILENCIRNAHMIWQSSDAKIGGSVNEDSGVARTLELSSNKVVSALNLAKVLETVGECELASQDTRKLIAKKLQFYDILIGTKIPYENLTEAGYQIQLDLKDLDSRYSCLMNKTEGSLKVLREVLILELCAKENLCLPSHLLEKYKLAIAQHTARNVLAEEHQNGTHLGAKYSPYNNKNVVLFTLRQPNGFMISQFTSNAGALLGVGTDKLHTRYLREFLPKEFSHKHDLLMLNYLNGESFCKRSLKIQGMVNNLERESTQSVIVYPKLELSFMSQVQVAALIVVRGRNRHPMIWTNLAGKVIGYNRKAEKIFQNLGRMTESTFFLTLPSLLNFYFPREKLTMSERDQLDESPREFDELTKFKSDSGLATSKQSCKRLDSLFTPRRRHKQSSTASVVADRKEPSNLFQRKSTTLPGTHVVEPEGQGFLESGNYNMENSPAGEKLYQCINKLEAFCFGMLPLYKFKFREDSSLIDQMREERIREETQDFNLDGSNKNKDQNAAVKSVVLDQYSERSPSQDSNTRLFHQDYMADTQTRTAYPFSSEIHFDSFLSSNRSSILQQLDLVTRVSLNIETQHYTNHISIREITVTELHRITNKVKKLFQKFASGNGPTDNNNPFSELQGFSQYLPARRLMKPSSFELPGETSPAKVCSPIQDLLYEYLSGGGNLFKKDSKIEETPSEFMELGFWPFLLKSQPVGIQAIFKFSHLRANQKLYKDVDKVIRLIAASAKDTPNKVSTPIARVRQVIGFNRAAAIAVAPGLMTSPEAITPKFATDAESGQPSGQFRALKESVIFPEISLTVPEKIPLMNNKKQQFLNHPLASTIPEEAEEEDPKPADRSHQYDLQSLDASGAGMVAQLMQQHLTTARFEEILVPAEPNSRRSSKSTRKFAAAHGNRKPTENEVSFARSRDSDLSQSDISFEQAPVPATREYFIPQQESLAEIGQISQESEDNLDDLPPVPKPLSTEPDSKFEYELLSAGGSSL